MYKVKYKGIKIVVKIVDYNFNYYCTKMSGTVLLYINRKESLKSRRNILHRAIKEVKYI